MLQGSSVSPLAFSLYNLADLNRVGLDLDSFSASGASSTLTTDLAPFTNLAQGGGNSFNAFLNTSTLGLFNAQYLLNLVRCRRRREQYTQQPSTDFET